MRSWKKIIPIVFVGSLLLIASDSLTNTSGPGGGDTGAPNETNCTRCHSGTLITSSTNLNNLKLATNFTGSGYIPDSTYELTISYTQSGKSKFGFQTTILDKSNKKVGTLASKGNRNQKRTKTISGSQREYIEHTSTGTASTGTNKTDWTFEWTAPSTNVGDVTMYVVLNATNRNSATSGDEIYAKQFTLSPSTLLPTASISSSDSVACAGTTVTFMGSGTNSPTKWNWSFPGGSPSSSTDQNPKVVFNFKGKFRVTLEVENSKGKSLKDTFFQEILAAPTAFIPGGATQRFCDGDSIKLTAQSVSGATYQWSNGMKGRSIMVGDTGAIYVTVTSGQCSKVSNLVALEHFPSTSVSLVSDAVDGKSCENSSINFTASSGFDSVYIYKNFNLVQTIDTHLFSQKMSDTADYNVKVLDNNGCISPFSDTVRINVLKPFEPPVVKCKAVTTNSATFEWTFNGHPNGYQISTDTGRSWTVASSGPTGLTHHMSSLTPEKNYTLMVRAIGDAPCVFGKPGTAVCKTSSCNTLDLKHTFDSVVCKGDSSLVVINGLKGKSYSLSFDNNPAFQDTMFYFTPDFSKTYTVFVTDSTTPGCQPEELDMKVQVDAIADVRLRTQNAGNQFCLEDTIRFRATDGNELYKFYVNKQLKATQADSFYLESKFKNGDSAYVVAQKGVCVSTSEPIGILVFPASDAGFSYSYANGEVKFTPNGDNYQEYYWEFGDQTFSVTEDPSHKYAESMEGDSVDVTLRIVDNNGCTNDSTMKVYIPFFSSVGEIDKNANLELYPNPSTDFVRIRLHNGLLPGSTIYVYSVKGDLIESITADSNDFELDTKKWEDGFYLIEVKTKSKGSFRQRLMVQ